MRRGEIFALSGIGLLLGVMVVSAWGRLGPSPGSRNPTSWLGLLAVAAPDDASKARLLLVLVPALSLLMMCWCYAQRLASTRRLTARAASVVTACWAFPFAIGPIIGSRDAYAYLAQGELAQRGLDPAKAVVSQLGGGPLLAAVDPRWRETRPPYGGVAVAIEKWAAVPDEHPGLGLLALRLVAVVAVLALVLISARMAPVRFRAAVIIAIGANPLVLIHLVGAAHLDAVAAALLVAGLAVARSGSRHAGAGSARHLAGIMLCTLGAMVKLPVALGAVYLTVTAVVAAPASLQARIRRLAVDLLAALAAIGLSMAISGSGLAWVQNFGTPGRLRTGIAPADMLAHALSGIAWLFGAHPSGGDVLSAARIAAGAAAGLAAAVLLLPRRRMRLDVSAPGGGSRVAMWSPPTLDRLALALLAVCLLGPVLYAWYLAPALPLLALAASRPPSTAVQPGELPPRRARLLITGLSIALTVAALPRLAPAWGSLGAHPIVTTVLGLVLASLAAAAARALAVARLRTGDCDTHAPLPARASALSH